MFSVNFNSVILAIAAMLTMSVVTPSWAGEPVPSSVPAAVGGMGFGPMGPSLLAMARTTKPIAGEEPMATQRDKITLAGVGQLPSGSPKAASSPPSVAQDQSLVVSQRN